jgi:putative transposase
VHARKGLRIRGFDYSFHGPYFVTVCTRNRRCILGEVRNDRVALTRHGQVVVSEIERLPERLGVELDDFVVMPNHVHLIVGLGTRARQASPLRLGTVVGSFKAGSSREVGRALWQRGYYDHVVRDEDDLARAREYIATNPIRWALDPENPDPAPNLPNGT